MEEQPVTEQRVVAQPKSRHHWFRISLFIVVITISLFTLGCFAAKANFDSRIKEKAEGTAESFCKTSDTEAPEITLNGNGAITLKVGEKYAKMLNDKYKKEYHEAIDEFIRSYFESGKFEQDMDEAIRLIEPYVEKDPTSFAGAEAFSSSKKEIKTFL